MSQSLVLLDAWQVLLLDGQRWVWAARAEDSHRSFDPEAGLPEVVGVAAPASASGSQVLTMVSALRQAGAKIILFVESAPPNADLPGQSEVDSLRDELTLRLWQAPAALDALAGFWGTAVMTCPGARNAAVGFFAGTPSGCEAFAVSVATLASSPACDGVRLRATYELLLTGGRGLSVWTLPAEQALPEMGSADWGTVATLMMK